MVMRCHKQKSAMLIGVATRFALIGGCLINASSISAGELTRTPDGLAMYQFATCERPIKPIIKIDPALRGSKSIRDYNAQVNAYNAYIGAVEAYMTCISDEADKDLQEFYNAVDISLQNEQEIMETDAGSMRSILLAGPNKSKKAKKSEKSREIPALEGAVDNLPSYKN